MFFEALQLILLIIILVFLILIWNKPASEGFENCFGMQYYGDPFLQNKNNAICAEGTTNPLYVEGGCAVYDPQKLSNQYADGKFRAAV